MGTLFPLPGSFWGPARVHATYLTKYKVRYFTNTVFRGAAYVPQGNSWLSQYFYFNNKQIEDGPMEKERARGAITP